MLDKSALRANRLSISVRDLEQSVRFLTEALAPNGSGNEIHNDTIHESLLLSAIIAYARPFSWNERVKAAKADPKITGDVLEGLNDNELKLHKKIVKLRNKAVAHSEFSLNPTKLTEKGVFYGNQFSIFTQLSGGEIVQFLQMAQNILKRAHQLRANAALHKWRTILDW